MESTAVEEPAIGYGRVALLAGAMALVAIACVEMFVEVGLFADGPGVGLFSRGRSWLVFEGIFIVAGVLTWVAWRRVRDDRERLRAFVGAGVLVASFLLLAGPRKLLVFSWTHRCDAGEAAACTAASGLYEDAERAAPLLRAGCERGSYMACFRILRRTPHDSRACASLDRQCRDEAEAEWRREDTCGLLVSECLPPR